MQIVGAAAVQVAEQLHHRLAVAASRGCRWARRRAGWRARPTSARATATRCCWPPESWPGSAWRGGAMPDLARARSSHALLALRRPHPAVGERQLDVLVAPSRSPIRLKLWKMKPISRLRMRARCGEAQALRPASRSARSAPSVGESSRPRIESSVDLPQPEGPAIETYSPLLDLEVDVREGVGLDLVGEEDLAHALELGSARRRVIAHRAPRLSSGGSGRAASQARHVGQDHLVAHLQPARRPRSCSPSRARARPSRARASSRPPRGGRGRPCSAAGPIAGRPDVEHVVEPLELDRAVHGEVGPRALRQLAVERHVHGDRPVLHRGVDRATTRASHDAVARVDRPPSGRAATSRACVSGTRTTAFRRLGPGDPRQVRRRARPAGRPRPATTCSTPSRPARTWSASTCERRRRACARRCSTSACCTRELRLDGLPRRSPAAAARSPRGARARRPRSATASG